MSAAIWSLSGWAHDPHRPLGGEVSIRRDELPGLPSPPPRIRVRARVWGVDERRALYAQEHAVRGPSRADWDLVAVDRHESPHCPLRLEDPGALAVDRGEGWAYVVYRVRDES